MTTIRTARLALRPVRASDGPALFPIFAVWNVVRWLSPVPWPYTPADHASFLAFAESRAESPSPIYVILLDGRPIGQVECDGQADPHAPLDGEDVGFWIGEPWWGNGYMSEALAALTAHVLAVRPEVAVIRSGWFEGNVGSERVHRKCGFEVSGRTTKPCRARGHDLPMITARLTRRRLEAVRQPFRT